MRVLTINTHKGLAAWNRRFVLSELRDAVRSTAADIVFLQEVIGEKASGTRSGEIDVAHYEYLADSLWPQFAYGRNAVYPLGHHGNALLSRFPIGDCRNHDASVAGHEPRGFLHCVLTVPGWGGLHVICVHLGLQEAQRQRQIDVLCELLAESVPASAPVLVAGDFNDWRERVDRQLQDRTELKSAFSRPPRTFPARWPLLPLDRIYLRNLEVQSACVLAARPWPHLSDHLPLLAEVVQ